MIVTCPACSSRYKFDASRLGGKSAKITCPSCEHVFVVHPPRIDPVSLRDTWVTAGPDSEPAPLNLENSDRHLDIKTADFSQFGVTWRVRQGLVHREFATLEEIQEALDEGTIDESDGLSHDGEDWTVLSDIDDIEAHFADLYARLEAGEIVESKDAGFIIGADEGDEDAPTTIVRTDQIQLDNREEDLDEPVDDAPPPAVPSFGGSDEPETETEPEVDPAPPAPVAVKNAPLPSPVASATKSAQSGGSKLPLVLAVVVVIAVVGLILYSQGVFGSVGG